MKLSFCGFLLPCLAVVACGQSQYHTNVPAAGAPDPSEPLNPAVVPGIYAAKDETQALSSTQHISPQACDNADIKGTPALKYFEFKHDGGIYYYDATHPSVPDQMLFRYQNGKLAGR